ncbi:protein Spindly-like [Littorina saxatilis]|uniref:Uncharacterized protein n=1 Tax=Littorina saxatilis TaxID=31220 RepID=A0AAN9AV06_9CAEN
MASANFKAGKIAFSRLFFLAEILKVHASRMESPGGEKKVVEDLNRRVEDLEAALEEQEQNLFKAATVGKSLLEENNDLRLRIDDLMKQHAAAIEEKHQEVCSLQSRTEVAASTQQWQQEEISNLRAELQTVRSSVTDQMEEERRLEVSGYKKQTESLRLDVDNLQSVETELRGRVGELEALLQTHLDRTQIHSTSTSFTSEEMAQLHEELTALRIDLTEERAKNIDLTGQLQQAEREREMVSSRLKTASTEIEELQCQVVTYAKHLEESRRETLEVRAQLDSARIESQFHGSKGNSLFSEVEDRRMTLEKMMASLKVQNKQYKDKYDIEKQQNQKYKMQIAMALQMSSYKQDPAVQRLRDQLSQAHAEIRTLTDHIQNLESSTGGSNGQMISADALEKVEDRNYAQYLMEIIKTEKENAAKARCELHTKSLQYLDVSNQMVDLSRRNQQLQGERDMIQSQLIKAALEKEELLLKYDPDRVKSGKLQKRVVEKIDMGDAQLQIQERVTGASGRPSDIFKHGTATGRPSNIFKPSVASGRLSDIKKTAVSTVRQVDVLKPLSAGRPDEVLKTVSAAQKTSSMYSDSQKSKSSKPWALESMSSLSDDDDSLFYNDKENFEDTTFDPDPSTLQGRKVSMADDVKVIYADGEESMAVLAREGDKSTPAEAMKKKKQPKAVSKVKHVTADEAPQYECKQQ